MYFPLALTSPDMTQPADNIDSITARHMSTTVSYINDVVRFAADIQTKSTERHDNNQVFTSQHHGRQPAPLNDHLRISSNNIFKILNFINIII
jgi:hypothetical protein